MEITPKIQRDDDENHRKPNKEKTIKPVLEEPQEIEEPSLVKKALSFGRAIASRGLYDNMANEDTISKRELSCHGNDDIEPCPRRQNSKKHVGRTICGACGCGDKPRNFLNGEGYLKLYYPTVTCPLQMPGFSNETPAKEQQNRKKRVEEVIKQEYNEQANDNNKESK